MIVFVLSEGSIAPHGWKTNCECTRVSSHFRCLISLLDIIALIVVGVIFLITFALWEHHLEVCMDMESEKDSETTASFWTPPPLMRISIWSRSRGKLGVMLVVACVDWCSFMSFTFWQTVCPFICPLMALTNGGSTVIFPKLSGIESCIDHDPSNTHVHDRPLLHHHRSSGREPHSCGVPCW